MNKLKGMYLMSRENEYKLGIETTDCTPEITIMKTDSVETMVDRLTYLIVSLKLGIAK